MAVNQTAPTSQAVFGTLIGLRGGDVLTGLKMRNATAAAGTTPTTARFGLADATGKILILSGNVNAAATWAAGVNTFPFTATFTVPSDGGYFACFVVNGTWGSTQPTPVNMTNSGAGSFGADGANPPINFTWAAQTDLPAVSSSVTITAQSTKTYWFEAY
jgi:hypothetical protein